MYYIVLYIRKVLLITSCVSIEYENNSLAVCSAMTLFFPLFLAVYSGFSRCI